ncbi:TetR/AcrR family transcriptional regulator [Streptomyces sp. NPDC050548]|uniref:TetR/AcrR family transcriptional regulator n=1 Tax=Streptomyces sp. NPDC050548 TaxID=3365629 RepID=UPI0037997F79
MATTQTDTGRSNQKRRTRAAIVEAARVLIGAGSEVTMPEIARAALVSEATAYRYFPDLPSLIGEALAGVWPDPAEALRPVADSRDPVERIAYACEFLLRGILTRQGGVRAMMAATIVRPDAESMRPGIRFGLIDHALAPLDGTLGVTDPDAFTQLKRGLAVVVGADALFTLTDQLGLTPDEAVASAVRTATTLTEAAVRTAAVG